MYSVPDFCVLTKSNCTMVGPNSISVYGRKALNVVCDNINKWTFFVLIIIIKIVTKGWQFKYPKPIHDSLPVHVVMHATHSVA